MSSAQIDSGWRPHQDEEPVSVSLELCLQGRDAPFCEDSDPVHRLGPGWVVVQDLRTGLEFRQQFRAFIAA